MATLHLLHDWPLRTGSALSSWVAASAASLNPALQDRCVVVTHETLTDFSHTLFFLEKVLFIPWNWTTLRVIFRLGHSCHSNYDQRRVLLDVQQCHHFGASTWLPYIKTPSKQYEYAITWHVPFSAQAYRNLLRDAGGSAAWSAPAAEDFLRTKGGSAASEREPHEPSEGFVCEITGVCSQDVCMRWSAERWLALFVVLGVPPVWCRHLSCLLHFWWKHGCSEVGCLLLRRSSPPTSGSGTYKRGAGARVPMNVQNITWIRASLYAEIISKPSLHCTGDVADGIKPENSVFTEKVFIFLTLQREIERKKRPVIIWQTCRQSRLEITYRRVPVEGSTIHLTILTLNLCSFFFFAGTFPVMSNNDSMKASG